MLVVEPCTATTSLHDEQRRDLRRSCFTDDADSGPAWPGTAKSGPFRGLAAILEFLDGNVQAQSDQRRHLLVSDIIEAL